MENYRIFVEKHPRFRVEADSLRRELNTNLNLDIRSLQLLNVYDLFGFSRELLEKSRYSVFGEVVTDSVTDASTTNMTRSEDSPMLFRLFLLFSLRALFFKRQPSLHLLW